MSGPLEGVKVIDMSAVISGPLAAMMLGDQGADVIKVEPPAPGESMRYQHTNRGGMSSLFANSNRGKRSISVDARRPEGRALILDLVRDADVFIQNYRVGVLDRLGLGDSDLRSINPGLIYCSISGFGPTGPYRNRRVYDPVIQSITGHVAVQLNPEIPIRDLVRNLVADKSTSHTAAQAITAALFARERGGGGQHIHVPMLDASLAFFWPDGMMNHTFVGDQPANVGPAMYEIYHLTETEDGHVIYHTGSEAEFRAVFRALGLPEPPGREEFTTHRARLDKLAELGGQIANEFRKWKSKDILERLEVEDVAFGPVLSLEELIEDPQVANNECIYEVDHPAYGTVRQCKPAARFSGTPQEAGRPAPLHGEHSDEIMRELGYDEARREELRGLGIVDAPSEARTG